MKVIPIIVLALVIVGTVTYNGLKDPNSPMYRYVSTYLKQSLQEGTETWNSGSAVEGKGNAATGKESPWSDIKFVVARDTPLYQYANDTQEPIETLAPYTLVSVLNGDRITSGDAAVFNAVSYDRVNSIGFMKYDSQRIYDWNSRMGWFPQRGKSSLVKEVNLYTSSEDAKGETQGKDVKPIAVMQLPVSRSTAHYPWVILETQKFTSDGQRYAAYKVAAVGRKGYGKSTPSKSEKQTIMKQLKMIDVFVCIDTTSSMSEWFDSVKDAVKEYAGQFIGRDIDARFQLTTYRDIEDGDEWCRIYPAGTICDFVDKVAGLKSGGGGDTEEAGYPALAKALENAQSVVRPRTERVMLIVGDAPYHKDGNSNPSEIGNGDIIKKTKAENMRVFTLAVSDGELAKQLSPINLETGGKAFLLNKKDALMTAMKNLLSETQTTAIKHSEVYSDLADGKSVDEIAETHGKSKIEIANVVRILREVKGIDFEKFNKGESVVLQGWVVSNAERDSLQTGTLESYLFRSEAEAILSVLESIVKRTDGRVMLDLRKVGGFGRKDGKTYGQIFDENGLPHRGSSILAYTPDEIAALSEEERNAVSKAVNRRIEQLRRELNEEVRWTTLPNGKVTGWVSENCLP